MFDFITFSLDNDVIISNVVIPAQLVKLSTLLGIAVIIYLFARMIVLPVLKNIIKKTKTDLDDLLINRRLLSRAIHLLPAVVISTGLPTVFAGDTTIFDIVSKALSLYYLLIFVSVFDALLNVVLDIYNMRNQTHKVGITGIIQALKVIAVIISIILAISVLAGKSPAYFITGLGAFTAILMLIFKDPILGLVAGVQLSAMDLIRKGDWIEIPKHGADGSVVEISLTTVKVRNWDMTFTAIPAYELVSSSFKNWRGMVESGGRRIKRSIWFSMSSIHFLTDEEIERLQKIKILRPYIDNILSEIEEFNSLEFSCDEMANPVNGRRLTNIGTFRAYCNAYLLNHAGINQNLIKMVRQLAPTELGLPLEIYAFTSDTAWIAYEGVQADIFDHLLAIAPEFGLTVYQRDLN